MSIAVAGLRLKHAFLLLSAVTCMAVAVPGAASAALPGKNGKIAFTSNRDGNNEIYVMNADGTGQVNLTNNSADDREAQWNPDGTKIAFSTTRDGNYEIYVMNADGTGLTRLTNNSASDTDPSWSPNGWISFTSNRDGNYEIYRMNTSGTNLTRLTTDSGSDTESAFSPSGTQIAFVSNRGGNQDLYLMKLDGTAQTTVISNASDDRVPNWDPITFKLAAGTDGANPPNYDVVTLGTNGSGLAVLTGTGFNDSDPAWSPDGAKIAFFSNRDGNSEIYTMNADGTGQTRRTTNGASDTQPDWQPLTINYPRPMGASPRYDSLVIAMNQCKDGFYDHELPQKQPSCYPATQVSQWVTVGTADFNSLPTKFTGFTRMVVVGGDPSTPADEADIILDATLRDIRVKSTGADYTGELGLQTTLQVTDRRNGGSLGYTRPGTSVLQPFGFAIPCAPTVDTTVGSTCSISTTADTLLPNVIAEGKRTMWQISDSRVTDGGADGQFATDPNDTFAVEGVFVP